MSRSLDLSIRILTAFFVLSSVYSARSQAAVATSIRLEKTLSDNFEGDACLTLYSSITKDRLALALPELMKIESDGGYLSRLEIGGRLLMSGPLKKGSFSFDSCTGSDLVRVDLKWKAAGRYQGRVTYKRGLFPTQPGYLDFILEDSGNGFELRSLDGKSSAGFKIALHQYFFKSQWISGVGLIP